jgi:hypothetical protein
MSPDDVEMAYAWLRSPEIFALRWKLADPASGLDREAQLVELLLAFTKYVCPFALGEVEAEP